MRCNEFVKFRELASRPAPGFDAVCTIAIVDGGGDLQSALRAGFHTLRPVLRVLAVRPRNSSASSPPLGEAWVRLRPERLPGRVQQAGLYDICFISTAITFCAPTWALPQGDIVTPRR